MLSILKGICKAIAWLLAEILFTTVVVLFLATPSVIVGLLIIRLLELLRLL